MATCEGISSLPPGTLSRTPRGEKRDIISRMSRRCRLPQAGIRQAVSAYGTSGA